MKEKLQTILFITIASMLFGGAVEAQVATGGNYTLSQSVIAGGGGTSADASGSIYSITGTIGQSVADTLGASGSLYKVQSGFFTPAPLAPTASSVSVSGRVLASFGRGLNGAVVVLTDPSGNERRTRTSAFGYFSFSEVAAGSSYIFSVESKRFYYTPQVLTINEDLTELIFNAVGQNPNGQKIK